MNPIESEEFLRKKYKKEESSEENSEISRDNEDNENGEYKNGRWEKIEHLKFLKGCLLHGNNWKKVIFNSFIKYNKFFFCLFLNQET